MKEGLIKYQPVFLNEEFQFSTFLSFSFRNSVYHSGGNSVATGHSCLLLPPYCRNLYLVLSVCIGISFCVCVCVCVCMCVCVCVCVCTDIFVLDLC